jgi:dipeptidyl aminopeptidase/acylaminoacyl peptidase
MTYDPKERSLNELYSTVAKGIPEGMEPVTGNVLFSPDKTRIYLPFRKKSEAPTQAEAASPQISGQAGPPGIRGAGVAGGRGRGQRPGGAPAGPTNREGQPVDPATAGVEVWHFTDAEVVTMRARGGGRQGGNNARLLHEVDLQTMTVRALESERLRGFSLNHNREFAVVSDDQPYRALRTWDRDYRDWFLVNLSTGERRVLARKSPSSIRWIADGRFLVWQMEDEWYLLDPQQSDPVQLLAETPIPRTRDAEGQTERTTLHFLLPDEQHLLFQDGFDLWAIPTNGSPGRCLTRTGRRDGIRYEPLVFDSEKPISDDGILWLTSWNRRTMARGVSKLHMESLALERCMVADRNVSTPIKAKNADRALVTMESADCPPDLWLAEGGFSKLKRVTETNAWLNEFAIPKSELITWTSSDGEELKGIVTFPPDHQWDTRPLPTIVYIYEELSQGLHRFSLPGLQMSPARWATEGYVVFQPDITYQIGRPGASSVKCVVPGVQKLIDRGITDKERVGLCGHSWGGYQTAYIITQTRLFAAAISGAPVVNMTSAYNGIRWSTGLPRQFQYERTQSRIGGSLWEFPERFIENSPVFHLENVTTPVLIMFGNNDGAVPWYQGIEYYLAMRRLNKEAVFLEYKGEDHGLRRRPNQEDYTKRISDWFGHYLKGHPKADWMLGSTAPEPLPPLKGRGAERPEVDQTQAVPGGAKG